MRKVLLVVILLLIVGIVVNATIKLQPLDEEAKVDEEFNHLRCRLLVNYGELVMNARQEGISIIKMIELVDDFTLTDERIRSFIKSLVIAAYEQPQYSTDRMKKRAIRKFCDDLYLGCIKQ